MSQKYTVGQKLWWVTPSNQHEITVKKVGTKYVTATWKSSDQRFSFDCIFNKDTGRENTDFRHVGRAFLSKDGHEEFVVMNEAWRAMCKMADKKLQPHTNPPAGITMSEIETITGILESLA